ncbi:glycoside hydrolase family 127 protein [bacterium]|nr:glycoside hydrolase family 127 protein [bacterium]
MIPKTLVPPNDIKWGVICCLIFGLILCASMPLNAQSQAPLSIPDSTWIDIPDATGDQVAVSAASLYRPYESRPASSANVTAWIQIDLGESCPIDLVRLYPSVGLFRSGGGFPVRFRIESSDDPLFGTSELIADRTASDYPNPGNYVTEFTTRNMQGRFVRLTVTRLATQSTSYGRSSGENRYVFSLSKVDVVSEGRDIAEGCPVTADSQYGNTDDLQQLTRPVRPQGEYIVTDNQENVTPVSSWKPVQNKVDPPLGGVSLNAGIFRTAMQNNIGYLLESYSVDQLLRQFWERAGKPVPSGLPDPQPFWEVQLAGSNAGRFLMGAGNTLRWIEDAELRRRMNAIVDGIEECRLPNGYIMAYPESTLFVSERAAYTRSWTTHGLIEAGYAGNLKAFELLRGYYDWYNRCPYLPKLLRGAAQGGQGMVANTRMYFTPVGKPGDIQVIQRYFQENYWLKALSERDVSALWQYPYDRPHCYLFTIFEAYLDLYRATGDRFYLDAILGAWDLVHNNWENIGGSISIIEFLDSPPKSHYLYDRLGETCGSAFWILINQRLHNLFPEEEKYIAEIEKSIYNVILANQKGSSGFRYHTMLVGVKEGATSNNTCCEGQGTRIVGSLAEYIYSIGADGIYINLFEPSDIHWTYKETDFRLEMETPFPFQPDVKLIVSTPQPVQMKIRIRIPSWASDDMPLMVNGEPIAVGSAGSYSELDRIWSDGDIISFTLPMVFKMTAYSGVDQIPNHGKRYALEYGPLLMAVVGTADLPIQQIDADNVARAFRPKSDQPLHFEMAGRRSIGSGSTVELMPYWLVDEQCFTCFPAME